MDTEQVPPRPDGTTAARRAAPRARSSGELRAGQPAVPAPRVADPGGEDPHRDPHGDDVRGLHEALTALRQEIQASRYALPLPSAELAGPAAEAIVAQLDDYLLPRLDRLDAPLLVVVGGSTGAGKSTLVNSLVRAPVSQAGVLRPTTRAPVLVCHPTDGPWFSETHLLPALARVTSRTTDPRTLQIVSALALRPGLALVDAPDIDSVVAENRALASQLFAAADLWLFVTTAARYADAVPWDVLRTARARGTAVALLLNRVPVGADQEIAPHLRDMLARHDLAGLPLWVLPEARLDGQGLFAETTTAPLRDWLTALARSAGARTAVVRQSVGGAVDALEPTVTALAAAADDQVSAGHALASAVRAAYRAAESTVDRGIQDGALLRGEVLARWQELVGAGDLLRGLQGRMGRLHDKVVGVFTQPPATGERFEAALQSGIVTLLRSAAVDAAEQAATAWRAHPAGTALLRRAASGLPQPPVDLTAPGADLTTRIERLVEDWRGAVLELVRAEVGHRRALARATAYTVNAGGLLVMAMVFTATSFLPTGMEIVVAGGTSIATQKVLEAIFGDQAVRALARNARDDLLDRVRRLLAGEADRYLRVLSSVGVDDAAGDRLREAAMMVASSRRWAGLPGARGAPLVLPKTSDLAAEPEVH